MVQGRSIVVKLLNERKQQKLLMAEYVCQPKYFLQIIFYFACYHTDASLLYQCVIEGKLLLGSAGTTLSQLWRETPLIHRILAQVDVFCHHMRYSLTR